jgi:hypothetical protein
MSIASNEVDGVSAATTSVFGGNAAEGDVRIGDDEKGGGDGDCFE